ncbi:laccase [Mycena pura]|uniref:laccase n=1 Tax=Mycena pura TaxID=153505 RepID=A0AAD6Y8J9_9AGAR|nr:laccase [Mycena pura]
MDPIISTPTPQDFLQELDYIATKGPSIGRLGNSEGSLQNVRPCKSALRHGEHKSDAAHIVLCSPALCQRFTRMSFLSLLSTVAIASLSLAAIGPTADVTPVDTNVAPDGFTRSAVTANGVVAGPLIAATFGDEFDLNVVNQLTDDTMLLSSSIHGLLQKNSSWADGPSFVTQCHIAANDSFLYTFSTAGQPGMVPQPSVTAMGCEVLWSVRYNSDDPHAFLYDVDNDDTVITLADWQASLLISTLINGLGRYAGEPTSQLAVINVTSGLQYRFRLVSLSCDPNFIFTIDGHTMAIIEVDGVSHQPLTVDSIQIFAGQRYSFILTANQASTTGLTVLPYAGAPDADPTTNQTASANPLLETSLHPLVPRPVPGRPVAGNVDVALNLAITFDFAKLVFSVNGAQFVPPTAPVLLQILSGAHTAAELLPPNAVVEVSIPGGTVGAPHPFHLHGMRPVLSLVQCANSSVYNYENPTGPQTADNVTIRFVTDKAGPWFLHWQSTLLYFVWLICPFGGPAIVFAEDTDTISNSVQPDEWDQLCPKYDALTPGQLGGQ